MFIIPFHDIVWATLETLYMVIFSTFMAILIGFPLGTAMFITGRLNPKPLVHKILNMVVNTMRSVPFIILLVALIPVTRLIIGTSIGVHAAIIPLSIGAAPFLARLIDNAYRQLPEGLLLAGYSMGATTPQMIRHLLWPEARSAMIQAITVTAITLVNYSAMAGTVGGGGLGDLAIRYGYQRFDITVMIITVLMLIIIVQCFQWIGDHLSHTPGDH